MNCSDWRKVLDPSAIKKPTESLLKKYHPDTNPGDKEAEKKFKEITEAYNILSDPEKKKLYDQFGHAALTRAVLPMGKAVTAPVVSMVDSMEVALVEPDLTEPDLAAMVLAVVVSVVAVLPETVGIRNTTLRVVIWMICLVTFSEICSMEEPPARLLPVLGTASMVGSVRWFSVKGIRSECRSNRWF